MALNQVAKHDRLNCAFYAGRMAYEANVERCHSCFNKWVRYRKFLNDKEKAVLDKAIDMLFARSSAMSELCKKQRENKKEA